MKMFFKKLFVTFSVCCSIIERKRSGIEFLPKTVVNVLGGEML